MSTEKAAPPDLERLREAIGRIDRELLNLIAERLAIARQISVLKQALKLPALDPAQEAAVVRRAAEQARALNLPVEPVRHLFWQLVSLTRNAAQ
jgi:chorismate mutase